VLTVTEVGPLYELSDWCELTRVALPTIGGQCQHRRSGGKLSQFIRDTPGSDNASQSLWKSRQKEFSPRLLKTECDWARTRQQQTPLRLLGEPKHI
jgi:hypothetical protein